MALFRFTAVRKGEAPGEYLIEGENEKEALDKLRSRHITPLRSHGEVLRGGEKGFFHRKSKVDAFLFTRQLAPLLESFITVHPEIVIERAIFEDADLTIKLQPSSDSAFEIPSEYIARLRISLSSAPKMGDYKATHEKTKYFDVLFRPTPAFACTRVCRVLKDYLASLL
jgi:hypothetical protein